jgi:hypothetical protein
MPPIFVGFLARAGSLEGPTPDIYLRIVVAVKPSDSPEFNAERIACELATATLLILLPESTVAEPIGRLSLEEAKKYGQPQIERPFEQGTVYVYEISDFALDADNTG